MRWMVTCAYDGTEYEGWQSQISGNTIQDFIERRLAVIFKTSLRIHGSGRTDAGVHASGQVFHFTAIWNHTPEELLRAFRCGFPKSVQVTCVRQVPDTFHARFSAIKKRYAYSIYLGQASPFQNRYFWSIGNRLLDVDAMREAAFHLLGNHNFKAFGAERGDGSNENPVRTLSRLEILRQGKKLRIVAESDGFLYKMVRSLTGTLTEVGFGRLKPQSVLEVLQGQKRTPQVVTAPPQGLCLEKVFYPIASLKVPKGNFVETKFPFGVSL